jgi:hypothetical protein
MMGMESYCEWNMNDAIPFGWYEGVLLHVKNGATHAQIVDPENPRYRLDRWSLNYPGRLWAEHKVITF